MIRSISFFRIEFIYGWKEFGLNLVKFVLLEWGDKMVFWIERKGKVIKNRGEIVNARGYGK